MKFNQHESGRYDWSCFTWDDLDVWGLFLCMVFEIFLESRIWMLPICLLQIRITCAQALFVEWTAQLINAKCSSSANSAEVSSMGMTWYDCVTVAVNQTLGKLGVILCHDLRSPTCENVLDATGNFPRIEECRFNEKEVNAICCGWKNVWSCASNCKNYRTFAVWSHIYILSVLSSLYSVSLWLF